MISKISYPTQIQIKKNKVVLSDGRIIHTGGPGRHFKKSSAGYNLTELMARIIMIIIIPKSNNAVKHAFVNFRDF